MKLKHLALGFALAALVGCAGNQQAMDRSMSQASLSQTVAKDANLDPSATASAAASLDSAKVLQEDGDDEEAIAMADKSALEYRLALVSAERDSLKKADERLEKDLRADVERKLLYQGILDSEIKGAK